MGINQRNPFQVQDGGFDTTTEYDRELAALVQSQPPAIAGDRDHHEPGPINYALRIARPVTIVMAPDFSFDGIVPLSALPRVQRPEPGDD